MLKNSTNCNDFKKFSHNILMTNPLEMNKMGEKEDTQLLLQIRTNLEEKIKTLETEITDCETAIKKIDDFIVKQGFRKLTLNSPQAQKSEDNLETSVEESLKDQQLQTSIKSKNGTTLGVLVIEDNVLRFQPSKEFEFMVDSPPFQSFFIERVLANMRKVDEEQAAKGELEYQEVLSFEVSDENGVITSINISNIFDDRRLREIRSSLRWTLDKMYDKLSGLSNV
jgi:hypothetical protein